MVLMALSLKTAVLESVIRSKEFLRKHFRNLDLILTISKVGGGGLEGENIVKMHKIIN